MAPKPGNAFAQQKELQRQKDKESQLPEEDLPSTPMTTMSMFIGPGPQQLEHPDHVDSLHKSATGKGILGRRTFTDPLGAKTAHSAEPSPFGVQSGGLSYMKLKITGKNKKNKSIELCSQPSTTPVPSEYLSRTSSSGTRPNIHTAVSVPEPAQQTHGAPLSQPHPCHLASTKTHSVVTRHSQYACPLENDAMILGNILMSPTRSGSYAVAGHPAVVCVSHPSIVSMAASIVEATPPSFDSTSSPYMYIDPHIQPVTYDTSYTAPLPPPLGEESTEQNPFHQQLPLYLQLQPYEQIHETLSQDQSLSPDNYEIPNSGTWEQMHAQNPATMPQFSPTNPKHSYHDEVPAQSSLAQTTKIRVETNKLRKASAETSLYNAHASDTKSESGREALEAVEYPESFTVKTAIAPQSSLRRIVSNHELRHSSCRGTSPIRTPVAPKVDKSSAVSIKPHVLSPTTHVFRSADYESSNKMTSTTLKREKYEVDRSKQSEPAQDLLRGVDGVLSCAQDASAPPYNGEHGHIGKAKGKESPASEKLGDFTTDSVYPPPPQHRDYEAQSNLEKPITHQCDGAHHQVDAHKKFLTLRIEDDKTHLADNPSPPVDEKFTSPFCQTYVQDDGFRQCLERIEKQTSNLRPGIATEVLSGVLVEMASHFSAHENRYREEFRRINKTLLTLNENVYAIQRYVNMQMAQMKQKMDLLLEAQGIDVSSGGHSARQDQVLMEQKLREEARRRKGHVIDPAAMVPKEEESTAANVAATSLASSPTTQRFTPVTKTRNPTPLPTKLPIMAAALTSTPPHVPELPRSQSQSPSFAKVTITDPSIPSPSAVSNARRIRQGDMGEPRFVGKESRWEGIVAKGLANTAPMKDSDGHIHPALRYQEGIEKLAGGKDKQPVTKTEDHRNEVLWRRPSDNGEIGGRWYKAAMQQ